MTFDKGVSMSKFSGIMAATKRVEQLTAVRVVRSGLINMIPVLIIGAFSLILQTLPLPVYQDFVTNFAGGILLDLFRFVYSATFGVLSLYMTYSISRSYMDIKADQDAVNFGAPIAALLSFFILSGAYMPTFGTDSTGPKSMFLAVISGLGASALYLRFNRHFRRSQRTILTTGADRRFNLMLSTLFPIAMIAGIFAVFNLLVTKIFHVDSFRRLLIEVFTALFSTGRSDFGNGFLFVLLSSLLWFFGIHGSDTLEDVMQNVFVPGLAENQAAVAMGSAPTHVITKEFFDCFVLMGGCGATICLLITILLFSKNRARRGLGYTAALPMIFNINELMVFGLPIVFNPTMLIPFLLTPLAGFTIAYAAISAGLVPMISSEVVWTTPILLSGFRATGSIAGSALQLVNVIVGVLIYLPFVKLLDRQSDSTIKQEFDSFVSFFKDNEQRLGTLKITELDDSFGDFAKGLTAELRHSLSDGVVLAYQPQYDYAGRCVGAESLLRWKHPVHGMLYPPLVFKLAEEGGFLPELEEAVFDKVLEDRPRVLARFGDGIKISVNVTGTTIVTQRFMRFIRQQNAKDPFEGKNLCVEVTEQAALAFDSDTIESLRALRDMGLTLAIDDFSMGQTSLHYLKDNLFDIIKLDGGLVKELFKHRNSREIVASITQLALSLNMTVLAEYVESEDQREALHSIGCDCYQGYLYSPAVFLDGAGAA
jgi:lactose/cellobiose-specific phosphotransferase system IIC component